MAEHKRKLAAIVFTDIVGFTKITADDQTLATTLLDKQRDLMKPIVEEHNGNFYIEDNKVGTSTLIELPKK